MGNVYFADSGDNTIKEWNATTQTVSTLVSSGLLGPTDVAVDGSGNVYIADQLQRCDQGVDRRNADSHHPGFLRAESAAGRGGGRGGNVYIADTGNNAVKEWNAAAQTVTTLFSSGLNNPVGLQVDGAGNVYFAVVNTAK